MGRREAAFFISEPKSVLKVLTGAGGAASHVSKGAKRRAPPEWWVGDKGYVRYPARTEMWATQPWATLYK